MSATSIPPLNSVSCIPLKISALKIVVLPKFLVKVSFSDALLSARSSQGGHHYKEALAKFS